VCCWQAAHVSESEMNLLARLSVLKAGDSRQWDFRSGLTVRADRPSRTTLDRQGGVMPRKSPQKRLFQTAAPVCVSFCAPFRMSSTTGVPKFVPALGRPGPGTCPVIRLLRR
jgi:hypothetical protein